MWTALVANLQQSMRSYFQHHGVFGHQAQALLEQHGAHEVVDVVFSRAVQSQSRVPLRLRDAGAHPARRTLLWLFDHLQ